MFRIMINALVVPLVSVGTIFFFIGTLGLLRFPDSYSRIHATTKCDTLGAGTIIIALALYDLALYGLFSLNTIKLLFIMLLIFAYSPTSGHLLARVAFRKGVVPWRKEIEITYREEQMK